MCDAACEPAEALELLGAQQLRLEPLPVGDVAHEGDVEAGNEVRSRGRLRDDHGAVRAHRLPLLAHRASLDVLGPERLHVREPLGRQELVEVAADQVALGDADQVAAGRIDVDVAAVVVGDEDRVERGVEDRAQLLLVLAQNRLGALADDRRRHEARSRTERVQLGGAPLALRDAVVEADEAPPAAVDVDRDGGDRADALRLEDRALALREVADVAGEDLVPERDRLEPGEPDLLVAHVLRPLVLELRRDPVRDPLEALAREELAVGALVVLEQVRAARAGGDAEALEQPVRTVAPVGRCDEQLGRMADGLEDRVAAMKCPLGALPADRGGDEAGGGAQGIGLGGRSSRVRARSPRTR